MLAQHFESFTEYLEFQLFYLWTLQINSINYNITINNIDFEYEMSTKGSYVKMEVLISLYNFFKASGKFTG